MNLFYQPLIPDGVNFLDQEESRHCIKVLRRNIGDKIHITDGLGNFYDAAIEKADARQCIFRVLSNTAEPKKDYAVHVAISPTKNNERLEWFVEKSVEIGIDRITVVECRHTERSFIKKERLEKVALSAMKQSLKATLPQISELTSFDEFIEQCRDHGKFIGFVDAANPVHLKDAAARGKNNVILIGPEGDFSQEELAKAMAAGFRKVSLGSSRLRTETAGIAACHILNLINT